MADERGRQRPAAGGRSGDGRLLGAGLVAGRQDGGGDALGRFAIVYARGQWLWLVRPQGGASMRLMRGNTPVWSPRGDKLLFGSIHEDRVSVLDPATRRVRVLGRGPETSVSLIAWSPDGRIVAFEVRTRGVSTVSVVRVADGRRVHSWRPGADVTSLFFTRDGSRIVYTLLSI